MLLNYQYRYYYYYHHRNTLIAIYIHAINHYYYACLVNLTSNEYRLNIGWKSDG